MRHSDWLKPTYTWLDLFVRIKAFYARGLIPVNLYALFPELICHKILFYFSFFLSFFFFFFLLLLTISTQFGFLSSFWKLIFQIKNVIIIVFLFCNNYTYTWLDLFVRIKAFYARGLIPVNLYALFPELICHKILFYFSFFLSFFFFFFLLLLTISTQFGFLSSFLEIDIPDQKCYNYCISLL